MSTILADTSTPPRRRRSFSPKFSSIFRKSRRSSTAPESPAEPLNQPSARGASKDKSSEKLGATGSRLSIVSEAEEDVDDFDVRSIVVTPSDTAPIASPLVRRRSSASGAVRVESSTTAATMAGATGTAQGTRVSSGRSSNDSVVVEGIDPSSEGTSSDAECLQATHAGLDRNSSQESSSEDNLGTRNLGDGFTFNRHSTRMQSLVHHREGHTGDRGTFNASRSVRHRRRKSRNIEDTLVRCTARVAMY
ncbi:hypothetical protein PTSG_10774 [Salpingoeca rosetta]|uniref:Uncharacterized protein n=1 Tax=Salpingoeca rosetta (strain ATCC 50818 / BSB-021) TaxID=946362 RepID=F2UQC1_SALR5|nr:uncharacterized protein PTSG_10774 [Salpingoeca rosetta]EGD79789.1 hypothetical protein PTSG_10774 [Salpingoeca rosetta]|eukprot:XP_004988738.1 hypothetical protein PTSG_10774 [Salpingoeca rosetta]